MTIATDKIARLNDAFRIAGPTPDWTMTPGVADRGRVFTALACRLVMSFDDFTEANDPYREHDFGEVEVSNVKVFWKIDCYDRTLEVGSPDPANPDLTRRIMTLMLPNEY